MGLHRVIISNKKRLKRIDVHGKLILWSATFIKFSPLVVQPAFWAESSRCFGDRELEQLLLLTDYIYVAK